jgi:hypothetical protein
LETNGFNLKQFPFHNDKGVFSFRRTIGSPDWITLSPKEIFEDTYIVNELKLLWGVLDPLEVLEVVTAPHLFLQPVWNQGKPTSEVIDYIKQNPLWRLSVQIQKYIGVR